MLIPTRNRKVTNVLTKKATTTTGHALLEQFEQAVADHGERVDARMEAVNGRLAALEQEQSALYELRARLIAARK